MKHLEIELSDVNPEINTDRDKVLELWGKKFLNIEVPALIKEIDDYFREGDFSPTKFATCIGRIRVLLVEVSKKIALGIANSKSHTSVTESSEEAFFFQYLIFLRVQFLATLLCSYLVISDLIGDPDSLICILTFPSKADRP